VSVSITSNFFESTVDDEKPQPRFEFELQPIVYQKDAHLRARLFEFLTRVARFYAVAAQTANLADSEAKLLQRGRSGTFMVPRAGFPQLTQVFERFFVLHTG